MKFKKVLMAMIAFCMMLPVQVYAQTDQAEYLGHVLVNGDASFDSDSIKNEDDKQWYWMSYPESRLLLHPDILENPYKKSLDMNMGLFVAGVKRVDGILTLDWRKENGDTNEMQPAKTTWYPYQFASSTSFDEGQVDLSEYFVDKDTIMRKFDVDEMTGTLTLSSHKPGGFQQYSKNNNILISETDRYWLAYQCVILDKDGNIVKTLDPQLENNSWNININLKEYQHFAVALTLGVKNVEGESLENTVLKAQQATENQNLNRLLQNTKEFWDEKLSKVPAPTIWGIQGGLDEKGVTEQQHRRAFYAAWTFNYQNILEETPETGYNYKQITLGKASMWQNGAPESPNNCSWESMFSIQQMAMLEPDIAWSAIEGFIEGIDENGILRGECLPSQKAHSVWLCYTYAPDKEKLENLYPKLTSYLKWRADNPRWIFGSHDYQDEKDISFVTQWYSDVDFMIKICKELNKYDDIAYWEQRKLEMFDDMREWFFTPAKGESDTNKIYNSYFTDKESHYYGDRTSDVANYITEALYIDGLPQDMQEKLVNYYLGLHDNKQDIMGFDFYKYGDGCYTTYALLEKATKYDELKGKGEELLNSILRHVIKTVEFGEEVKPNSYTPSGENPSSFTASAVIDYTYLNNGVRIDQGKMSAFQLGETQLDTNVIPELETSVLKGKEPVLPRTVDIGKTSMFINWEDYDHSLCQQAGQFEIKGQIADSDQTITMKVYVYDENVNYDVIEKTVVAGQIPSLPQQIAVQYTTHNQDYRGWASVTWEDVQKDQIIAGQDMEIKGHLDFNQQDIVAKIHVLGGLDIQCDKSYMTRYDTLNLKVVDQQGNEIDKVEWSLADQGNRPIAGINQEGQLLAVEDGEITVIAKISAYDTTLEKKITILPQLSSSLAYGSDVTVTSQIDSARGGKQATDGDESTMWRANENNNQSMIVDLGRVCELDGISNLWFEETRPKKYRISVSTDGQNFEAVTTQTTTGNGKQSVRDVVVFDEKQVARYVKVEVIETGSYAVGIQEFEAYGQIKDTVQMTSMTIISETNQFEINQKAKSLQLSVNTNPNNVDTRVKWEVVGTNGKPTRLAQISSHGLLTPLSNGEVEVRAIALDGSGIIAKQTITLKNQLLENLSLLDNAEVSATSNGGGDNIPEKAIDGDMKTRWGSRQGASQTQELKVDFGKEYNVSSVALYCDSGAYPVDYQIQYWNGSKFVDIINISGNDSPNMQYDFEEIQTKAIRIYTTKTTNNEWGFSVWEFEIYGQTPQSALKNLYDIYKGVDQEQYQSQGWQAFQDALDDASTLINQTDASMEDMASAEQQLQDSFDALILRNNFLDLNEAIQKAEKVNSKLYTPKTLQVFNEAFQKAQDVYANKDASQDIIDEAENDLNHALQQLMKKADKGELEKAIEDAKKLDEKDYTSSSFDDVQNALMNAEEVYADDNASEADVINAIKSLTEACENLVTRADNSALKTVVKQAEELDENLYTSVSYQALQTAIKEANAILNDPNATEKQINDAIEKVNKAKKGLDEVQRDALNEMLSNATAVDLTQYTQESVKVLETAIANAQAALKTTDQEAIDAAYQALQEAYKGLVKEEKPEEPVEPTKPVEPSEPGEEPPVVDVPETPNQPNQAGEEDPVQPTQPVVTPGNGEEVNTSDETPIVLLTFGLIVSGMGYLIVRKRKEN